MRSDARVSPGGPPVEGDRVFESILVGIDATPESLVAAAQAGVLRASSGRLVLLAVAERYLATHAGLAAADAEDRLRQDTLADLARAKELVDADDALLVPGRLVDVLRGECARRSATLLAVGVQPHRRLAALTFGGHDVEALNDAPCSVLIARPGWGPHTPDRIVVGVDGSPEGMSAEAVARSLGARLGCEVFPVVGLDGDVDLAVLRAERADALLEPGPLVDAVARAAGRGSLVIVGRGRRDGRRRAAAIVERIVYSTRCSVLVVQAEPAATA